MDCGIDGFIGGDLAVLCLYLLRFYANSFLIIVCVPGTHTIPALNPPSLEKAGLLFLWDEPVDYR